MKIDTNTLLILGAAGVGIYFLTRPKTVPVGYNPVTGLPYGYGTTPGMPVYNPNQPNATAQIIAAGGSALDGISDILGHFFDVPF